MLDLTVLNILVALWGLYYGCLSAVYVVRRLRGLLDARTEGSRPAPDSPVVLVVPAHNEEDVIEATIRSLLAVDYERLLIMVMNDGSSDRTAEIAGRFVETGRVMLVNRGADVAGRGKGAVLNDAFRRIKAMLAEPDGPLSGVDPASVIVGVMDADGQLERHALRRVAPLFSDPEVGAVQIGVRIANARDNVLTRFQDMEFVGFSAFVQEARDVIGSVGLGGNGQFTRFSALVSLKREPWTDCLTEDLDLGLSLVEQGWRIRFTSEAFVAQQGVVSIVPLLRQRTRWVQGHYQCWSHIPRLLMGRRSPLRTRLDLILYLVMVVFVLLITAGVVLNLAAVSGLFVVTSTFLGWLPEGPARNGLQLLISIGPLLAFFIAYQHKARSRFQWWEVPAFMAAFSAYTYVFVVSQAWAFLRMVAGHGSWVKTPRTEAEPAV